MPLTRDAAIALVFLLTLAATVAVALLGRAHSQGRGHEALAEEKLNRWLIGLSAGAAANSGFVVTGAVALGYNQGLRWVLLPLAWLVGDVVFWTLFPGRLNALGRESRATTLSDLLSHGLPKKGASAISLLCAAVILVCLSGYASAQWLAGEKFIEGAFPVSGLAASAIFALAVVSYTSIGGFRGSVYVDSLQALIRIAGTALAAAAIGWVAWQQQDEVRQRIAAADPGFLLLFPDGLAAGAAFILGFAAAALGFGLAQPHLVSRYLAGASPRETRSAWWIYIGFLQFTWVTMSLFGVLLRFVMPGIADPEAGLSVFFHQRMGAVATGVIVADVFATVAATSNSLLVAMGQTFVRDIAPRLSARRFPLALACVLLGCTTMLISLVHGNSVVSLVLASVSLMAAGIAPAVLAKLLRWPHDSRSLALAIIAGMAAAGAWKAAGLDALMNESAIGIALGCLANYLAARRLGSAGATPSTQPAQPD